MTSPGRCDFHRKEKERDRSRVRRAENRERNRFYARKRWAMTRKHKLFLNPLCELEHPGCLRIASEVHDRIAIEDGGDEYALDNLVSACTPCQPRKFGSSRSIALHERAPLRYRARRVTAGERSPTSRRGAESPRPERALG